MVEVPTIQVALSAFGPHAAGISSWTLVTDFPSFLCLAFMTYLQWFGNFTLSALEDSHLLTFDITIGGSSSRVTSHEFPRNEILSYIFFISFIGLEGLTPGPSGEVANLLAVSLVSCLFPVLFDSLLVPSFRSSHQVLASGQPGPVFTSTHVFGLFSSGFSSVTIYTGCVGCHWSSYTRHILCPTVSCAWQPCHNHHPWCGAC